MKICLVGSSGGHLTHLMLLKDFWSKYGGKEYEGLAPKLAIFGANIDNTLINRTITLLNFISSLPHSIIITSISFI